MEKPYDPNEVEDCYNSKAESRLLNPADNNWYNGVAEETPIGMNYIGVMSSPFPALVSSMDDFNNPDAYCDAHIYTHIYSGGFNECSYQIGCYDSDEVRRIDCSESYVDEATMSLKGVDIFPNLENEQIINIEVCGSRGHGLWFRFDVDQLPGFRFRFQAHVGG